MPTAGAHAADAMPPPPPDGMTWSEADYDWDPVKMIATARKPAGAATAETGLSDQTALPVACSAAGTVPPAFLASLTHKAMPGTSSGDGSPCGELGGCGAGPTAAAASKATPPRGKGRAAGRAKKGTGVAAAACQCQADGCTADLTTHTYYHQRNKICTVHIKADVFVRGGEELRFCQRCGHAHPLAEFDPGKHSCRKQLEKHNARRRKRQQEQAGAQQSSDGEDAPAVAAAAAAAPAQGSARPSRRRQAAKRSRVKEESESPPAGRLEVVAAPAVAVAAASPSADVVEAFAAAWGACLPTSSVPSAGVQDESGSAGEATPTRTSPVSASLQQQLEQQAMRAAGGPLQAAARQLSTHSGPPSLGPDTSASGSAVATTMAEAAPPAAAAMVPAQRPPSPALLPVLDFDFDLKPTPFEELLRQPLVPLDADEELLADDLAAWLNRNLAEDEQRDASAAPQQAQQQQLGWQHGPGLPPLALPAASAAGWGPEQLQQQPASLHLANGIMQRQVLDPLDALLPLQQQSQNAQHSLRYLSGSRQQPAGMQQQAYGDLAVPGGAVQGSCQGPPSPTLATVSVKLFGCTPEELPLGLRDHLRGWFDGSVHGMDGYLRPGCVHLTVQALLDGYAAERLAHAEPQPVTAAEPQPAAGAGTSAAGMAAAGEVAKAAQAAKSCCARPLAASAEAGGVASVPAGNTTAPGLLPPPSAVAAPALKGASAGACCGRKRAAEGPAEAAGGSDSAVRRVVDRMLQSGEVLWRSKTMLVQAGSHVALVHQGRLRQTWDIESSSARAVPAILEASPPLLLASQPGELCVSGINMLQNDCRLLLRLQGRYVQPAAATCRDCTCSAPIHPGSGVSTAGQVAAAMDAASFEQRCCGCCVNKLQLAGLLPPAADPPCEPAHEDAAAPPPAEPADKPSCCRLPKAAATPAAAPAAGLAATAAASGRRVLAGAARLQTVRLHLPNSEQQELQLEPLLPGLLHLDIQRRAYSAPRGARVLVVSSPAVHRELLQLIERSGAAALPPQVIEQLGVVHEWLGRPEKMQYQVVEAVAARLLYWAVGCGLPATADLLLSVLQAQGGSSSTAAAAVLQRAIDAEAASGAVTALSSMDGLQHLHLSMQATIAAAVQRAGELACRHGISLLHRAVQSGCGATLRTVLGWGEDAGGSWRCDLQGPQGITPLHLAALLPDPAVARHTVLLLLGRCAPGAQAWDCSCTADGQTPAHFFRAAAAARCGDAAEAAVAALETEVAVLRQLQQPRLPAQAASASRLVQSPALLASVATKQLAAAGKAVGEAPAAPAASLSPRSSGPEMQPTTPRKNPGCLCAPGCPCALLDRCACCSSDSEEEEAGGTCGGGSGKCCCCSDASCHVVGCVGCSAAADGSSGGCCGVASPAAAPTMPSCCGVKK